MKRSPLVQKFSIREVGQVTLKLDRPVEAVDITVKCRLARLSCWFFYAGGKLVYGPFIRMASKAYYVFTVQGLEEFDTLRVDNHFVNGSYGRKRYSTLTVEEIA